MPESGKGKCSRCKAERDTLENNKYYPFCSEKCKLVDLWGWMNEEYNISESLPNINEDSEKPDPFWRN